ncbi:uncharacterized protein TNCV_1306111 [Trichonephila clavipes]|nr:uncharacterized protein TNCV_1306111 [Trichonephila clavipes]
MWSRSRPSPSVVHCQFFELFGARRSTASKLSHDCRTVPLHTSSYCAIEKSSFSKADNPPPFKLRNGISSDDTKYSALVANLDAETLSYVSDIVLSPPNSDKYHTLSQRLITQFSDSETQKIKKLLTDLQLGDEKPSHLLRKMKELSNGQLQDDFLKSLWLQRMPPHIQTVLSASSEPLDKLAIIADKVSDVVGASSTICAATTVPPPSQSSSCSAQPTMDSLARQIRELSLQVAELTRERNSSRHQRYSSDRRRSHSRSRSVNRGSGICYYHRRYKEQARKCVSPCAFVQKNE